MNAEVMANTQRLVLENEELTERVAQLEQQVKQREQLVCCLLRASGGKISVPTNILRDVGGHGFTMHENPTTGSYVYTFLENGV